MEPFPRDRLSLVREQVDCLIEQVKATYWGPETALAHSDQLDVLVVPILVYLLKERKRANNKQPQARPD